MSYDATLKDLFQQAPQRLLQILVGSQAKEILTVEYPVVKLRRPDLVVRLQDNRLYHLELQSQNDEQMPWRMLEYYMLIQQTYQQSPLQQVLYVGQANLTMLSQLRQATLSYVYQTIDIRQINCRQLLESPHIADNLLAILCGLENKQAQVVTEILRRIGQLKGKTRQNALEQLRILAGLRTVELQNLIKQGSQKMPITVDMRNTICGIELFEQGEQKGKLEGKLEGESLILKRQLEKRFGTLPEWVITRIKSAHSEELEAWSLNVLDAKQLQQVFE